MWWFAVRILEFLRPWFFTKVDPANGLRTLTSALRAGAAAEEENMVEKNPRRPFGLLWPKRLGDTSSHTSCGKPARRGQAGRFRRRSPTERKTERQVLMTHSTNHK